MPRDIRAHLRYQQAQHVLRKVMGTHRASLVFILALLIAVSVAAAGIRELLQQACGLPGGSAWIADVLPLAVLLVVLYFLARRGPSQQRPKIHEYNQPAQARAIILFLSPVPKAPHPVHDVLDGKATGRLTDRAWLATWDRAAWRMPLEAIAYHAATGPDDRPGALEHVVVIGSSDRIPGDGSGTVGQFGKFRDLVEKLRAADPQSSAFKVVDLHSLICHQRMTVVKDYQTGVDFERPQELEEAVYHAYRALNALGIDDDQILVDVTGGQKPASIAGAVVALAAERRIQYISTHDYRVRAYDVTIEG
jgi:hypothetical protein